MMVFLWHFSRWLVYWMGYCMSLAHIMLSAHTRAFKQEPRELRSFQWSRVHFKDPNRALSKLPIQFYCWTYSIQALFPNVSQNAKLPLTIVPMAGQPKCNFYQHIQFFSDFIAMYFVSTCYIYQVRQTLHIYTQYNRIAFFAPRIPDFYTNYQYWSNSSRHWWGGEMLDTYAYAHTTATQIANNDSNK